MSDIHMTGKVPYHGLYDDKETAPLPLILRFDCSGEKFLASEYYCVNAGCDCFNAELIFSKMTGARIDEMGLFFITINTETWTVEDFGAFAGGLNLGSYVKEFMEQLPQYKNRLAGHVGRARWLRQAPLRPEDLANFESLARSAGMADMAGMAGTDGTAGQVQVQESSSSLPSGHLSSHPSGQPAVQHKPPGAEMTPRAGATIDRAQIAGFIKNGQSVGFSEVYDPGEDGILAFAYDDEAWYEVDDQYCMNPRCKCNEAILHFIRIDKASDQAAVDFVIRQKLDTRKYEMAVPGSVPERTERVIQQFWLQCQGVRKTLQDRYQQMKKAGQESLLTAGLTASTPSQGTSLQSPAAGRQPGRNAPCPCGSGKKYKHCCGK